MGISALVALLGLPLGYLQFGAFASAGALGIDHATYNVFAIRWWETGSMYLPHQVSGPFDPRPQPHDPPTTPSMYPPVAALLFLPFTVFPGILWWAIPIGTIAAVLARWRPAPWTWPVMTAALLYPPTWATVWVGNTTMWVVAALALGLDRGWGGPLILLKPSLAPFALAGALRRGWWVTAMAIGLLSVPFGSEWIRYLAVVRNAEASLGYSVESVPLLAVVLLAWIARTTGSTRSRPAG